MISGEEAICPFCKSKKVTQIINEGIIQEVFFDDGFIIKEATKYTNNKMHFVCRSCGHKYDE